MKKSGHRSLKQNVRTAKKRKTASTKWLKRQLNDPYVKQAKREGYRSRAAYKLIELDDTYHILKPGKRVLDLGAAPGGWSQVAAARVSGVRRQVSEKEEVPTLVLAVDLLPVPPIPGVTTMQLDFMDEQAPQAILAALGGTVDIVLSDLAPNTMGHAATDHIRIIAVVDAAYAFACEVLAPRGTFICKVRQGGTEHELLKKMKRSFASVRHAKPDASRKDSAETYVVAMGFRG